MLEKIILILFMLTFFRLCYTKIECCMSWKGIMRRSEFIASLASGNCIVYVLKTVLK
jgi:hypothetical protein